MKQGGVQRSVNSRIDCGAHRIGSVAWGIRFTVTMWVQFNNAHITPTDRPKILYKPSLTTNTAPRAC